METEVTVGFVAGQLPQLAESYRPHGRDGILARAIRAKNATSMKGDVGWQSSFWYPTLLMHIEIKSFCLSKVSIGCL